MAALTVSYSRKGDVHTIDTGSKALGTIIVDNTNLAPEEKGGTAKQLLASSALYCYCAALVGALDARGAQYSNIEGKAVLETGSNDKGQGRVTTITLHVTVTLAEDDAEIFERCEKIMKQGCLVTGSLHDGINMVYDLQSIYEEE